MTRAEALMLVIEPMAPGMARLVIRETLKAWPTDDVVAWHRIKDLERKRAKPQIRSGKKDQTGTVPVVVSVEDRNRSGRSNDGKPEQPPSPSSPPSSPPAPPLLPPLTPPSSLSAPVGTAGNSKKSSAEPAADPRFAAVNAGYADAYQAVVGSEYHHQGGKDGTALSKFLKTTKAEIPVARILGVMTAALQRGKEPFAKACKRAGTLAGFCNSYNEIRHELVQSREERQRQPELLDAAHKALSSDPTMQF